MQRSAVSLQVVLMVVAAVLAASGIQAEPWEEDLLAQPSADWSVRITNGSTPGHQPGQLAEPTQGPSPTAPLWPGQTSPSKTKHQKKWIPKMEKSKPNFKNIEIHHNEGAPKRAPLFDSSKPTDTSSIPMMTHPTAFTTKTHTSKTDSMPMYFETYSTSIPEASSSHPTKYEEIPAEYQKTSRSDGPGEYETVSSYEPYYENYRPTFGHYPGFGFGPSQRHFDFPDDSFKSFKNFLMSMDSAPQPSDQASYDEKGCRTVVKEIKDGDEENGQKKSGPGKVKSIILTKECFFPDGDGEGNQKMAPRQEDQMQKAEESKHRAMPAYHDDAFGGSRASSKDRHRYQPRHGNVRPHEPRSAHGDHQRGEDTAKPKKMNRSYAFYRKDKDPENDGFFERFSHGSFRSFSTDYDSRRDGPRQRGSDFNNGGGRFY